MSRRALPLSALLFLWPAVGGCGRSGVEAGAPGASSPASPFALADLDGNTVDLAALKGRVVFLDFWATWCPPCRASLPEVEKLHADYRDAADVRVLGMNLDEDADDVRRFVKKKGIAYPVLLAASTDLADRYGVRGIPHFVVIDKDGRVAADWSGYAPGMPAAWRKAIERARVSPPAPPARSGARTY